MMTEVRSQRMGRLPAASRLQAITEMVDAGSSISIAGLAEQYSVSMETIRRDIAALEKEGLVYRVHGGAMPAGRSASINIRVNNLILEKTSIGVLAARLVEKDEWIFLTHGSTTLSVARALNDGPPISVMTNMPAIAEALHGGAKHRVVLTGGEYNHADGALGGQQVLEAISECVFDTVIMGTYGINPVHGLVEAEKYYQHLKRLLCQRSSRRIFVADHSKFGASGPYVSVPLSDIGIIVTDDAPPKDFVTVFNESGVKVIYPSTVGTKQHDL